MQFEFSFLETILWTNVGGTLGVFFFAFLSNKLISRWNRIFRKSRLKKRKEAHSEKKIFTKKNRRIVRIKQQYGLLGIAISTPLLLSIPVGAFLMVRYYHSSKAGFIFLIASNLIWSVIYAAFYLFWEGLFFK